MSIVEQFRDISNKVVSKELSVEAALEQIKNINFNLFSITDIELVQKADWLPDQEAVNIMKGWMRLHDQVLLQLRAFLVVTPEITKDQLITFVKAVQIPSQVPSLTVENVIHKLATAGGAREFKNPVVAGLITIDNFPKERTNTLYKIFEPNPEEYYLSSPQQQPSITISLPPFLKIQIEKYQIGTPKVNQTKKGGLQSWVLEVTDDPSASTWKKQIATVQNDQQLAKENVTVTYEADNKEAGFYRHIRLVSTSQSHAGNLSMVLRDFDITGKLIISKD